VEPTGKKWCDRLGGLKWSQRVDTPGRPEAKGRPVLQRGVSKKIEGFPAGEMNCLT